MLAASSTAEGLRSAGGLTFDRDGRLRIAVANLSKAGVNRYRGDEIPNWRALGLKPGHIYPLLRDPRELEKAAPTFNSIPILSRHVDVAMANHRHDLFIGTTGSDARFVSPYLQNSLFMWAREGIDAIRSGIRRQLSSAYRFRAVMIPGTFRGELFVGRMTDISGSHVALVSAGRVGPDVGIDAGRQRIHFNYRASFPETQRLGD